MADPAPSPMHTPHPLAIPDYRAYWIARLGITLAQNGLILIVGWQAYTLARATMTPAGAAARSSVATAISRGIREGGGDHRILAQPVAVELGHHAVALTTAEVALAASAFTMSLPL